MKMNNQEAYNNWSHTYDTVLNKTRDLEAWALKKTLYDKIFDHILEIGCGTGKNTSQLLTQTQYLTGIDFSEDMLEKAKLKITTPNASFLWVDIREKWPFDKATFDLATCSLILEHIENIDFVFQQAHMVLKDNGLFYIGEYHPFKQYQGKKAQFEAADNTVFELECFTHHVSDFFQAALSNGFECINLNEWFDENEPMSTPRILTMLFRKK
jgi:ubiquinone/menaquinone biosynthesis C-methylase UbiE